MIICGVVSLNVCDLLASYLYKLNYQIGITLTTSRRACDSLGLKPNTSKREVSKNTPSENTLPWVVLIISR